MCGSEFLYFKTRDAASKPVVLQRAGILTSQVRVKLTMASSFGRHVWEKPKKDHGGGLVYEEAADLGVSRWRCQVWQSAFMGDFKQEVSIKWLYLTVFTEEIGKIKSVKALGMVPGI